VMLSFRHSRERPAIDATRAVSDGVGFPFQNRRSLNFRTPKTVSGATLPGQFLAPPRPHREPYALNVRGVGSVMTGNFYGNPDLLR
jgi:hypothetical protein